MPFSLKEIADKVGGKLIGEDLSINSIASLEDAKEEDLSFLLGKKFVDTAKKSKAQAIIVPENITLPNKSLIQVKTPRSALATVLQLFEEKDSLSPGAHPTAVIHPEAKVDPSASVGPYTVIGKNAVISRNAKIYPHVFIGENVEIGEDTIVYPQVVVYPKTIVGKRAILHSGCILGLDGYGFVRVNKKYKKIPQLGRAVVGDDCEIYSNSCVAKATIGETIIGEGTKIDTLTHVGHNCKIGKNSAITSYVALAGSVTLGENVVVAGQAGFNNHVEVGDNSVVMARAGITKNVPANSIVSGFPAQDHKKELEDQAKIKRFLKEKKK
jgi:UDP-3-O-[3-hydroxymyristoyl] glucosamine N-acyltransferase